MSIDARDAERAGHTLRVAGPKVAEATVAEQYRIQPDLPERYGPDGWRYCVRDVGHHVEALAASVDLGDPGRFAGYVRWARDVLAAHGIPAGDFLVSLRAMRVAVMNLLPPESAEAACRHIDAGVAVWEEEGLGEGGLASL